MGYLRTTIRLQVCSVQSLLTWLPLAQILNRLWDLFWPVASTSSGGELHLLGANTTLASASIFFFHARHGTLEDSSPFLGLLSPEPFSLAASCPKNLIGVETCFLPVASTSSEGELDVLRPAQSRAFWLGCLPLEMLYQLWDLFLPFASTLSGEELYLSGADTTLA